MFGEQVKKRIGLLTLTVLVLAFVAPACGGAVSPILEPSATPEPTHTPAAASKTPKPTETPQPTDTSTPTNTPEPTDTPKPTRTPWPTATPGPLGEVDTGMGGNLSIRGVVRDDLGHPAPFVYVELQAYGERGEWLMGKLGTYSVYTDEAGFYAFNNLLKAPGGHYQFWFISGHSRYEKVYEDSAYWIEERRISGDTYVLDVTVHAVTGSSLRAAIQYEDVDGSLRVYADVRHRPDEPFDHYIELFRGIPDNREYPIGFLGGSYSMIVGNEVIWNDLAGGTYFIQFTYRRSDGVLLRCTSPPIEVPPGEVKQFEYVIRNCPPKPGPLVD